LYSFQASSLALREGFLIRETSSKRIGRARQPTLPSR